MKPIISVKNLSKQYRIGRVRAPYLTLRELLAEMMRAPLKFLRANGEPIDDTIWALKDISFEIAPGEVVGIIGRNGAGKSTLLKILSRITDPTIGEVDLYGRVGSLLEIGTGFHPELTGRENIYLNGAILGMKKAEIDRRFDEMVAFAEIDKFLDTPVKHYSTGMHVRLAFAVAAHLEPEILVVDEVLAVGDASFQKKCLGKMDRVAKQGRTVLFVSHNLQAISQLTHRCLLLAEGECRIDGPTAEVVKAYVSEELGGLGTSVEYRAPANAPPNHLASARVYTSDEDGRHRWGQSITFEFQLRISEPVRGLCFSFQVVDELQQPICHLWIFDSEIPFGRTRGSFKLRCEVPKFRLYMGSYSLTTWFTERRGIALLEQLQGICPFEVTMQGSPRQEYDWMPGACAYLEDATWTAVGHEPFE